MPRRKSKAGREPGAEEKAGPAGPPRPVKVPETVLLPLSQLVSSDWNPNEQDAATFGALVESIQTLGFVEPVLVVPLSDGRYQIVAGHHRAEAGRVLGMEEVSAVVLKDFDEDQRKVAAVRMNMVRGQLNPMKFTRLFNELRAKYAPEALRALMGITSETEWNRLYRDVRKSLPAAVAAKLDAARKEIGDVEGLARIIQRIFKEHGEMLDYGFLVFEYGGQQHLVVKMTDRVKKNVDRICDDCLQERMNINDVMCRLLEHDLSEGDRQAAKEAAR